MAIIKCKMCGGDLEITAGMTVAECEYCGSKQTIPSADNEKKLTLFSRANRLRFACEFDKAAGVYEALVADFPEEAEAYWGLVLCKYGIEYVDDPATGKKIPTCHRSSFDSVMDDHNLEMALEYADVAARKVYREEAKQIEELRKGIIEVSGKEEPYDIFICYKETAEDGGRTLDSVLAQDVYDALTDKGYRVFFSRITLEDKLGQEYEPYIFAALNSAKLMLAFGTDYEYFNAVWVKNEWSRYLQLMIQDKTKHLIPCYKGIDAYDMPKEFAKLQAQDLGKVGAVQDLLRGIEKLLPRQEAKQESPVIQQVTQQVVQSGGSNVQALLQRGTMALEDSEWEKAEEYFDQVLNMDAQCAEAYLGMTCVKWNCTNIEDLGKKTVDVTQVKNFLRAQRYASGEIKNKIQSIAEENRKSIREKEEVEAKRKKQQEQKRKELSSVREKLKRVHEFAAIAAGHAHTVGLKSDGTVVVAGDNEDGRCDVSQWQDIVAIAPSDEHTVGLKSDGTVVAAGGNRFGRCDVSQWQDIVAIAAGSYHTVGLKSDGTVVAVGDNEFGRCDVSQWQDIVAIAAGYSYTVGLKSDGTVVAVGGHKFDRRDVSQWQDIVAITVGTLHTVGLKSDGTVVAVGNNEGGECDVSQWQDIVAIAVGCYHTVGLKSDGTVVAVGDNMDGKCDVQTWKLFSNIESLEEERKNGIKLRREEMGRQEKARQEAIAEIRSQIAVLQAQRDALSLFSFGARKELAAEIAALEAELEKK